MLKTLKWMGAVFALALLLALPAMAAEDVAIDETNFPDANFRSYVSENFDTDGSGALSAAELETVTAIDVSDSEISSLKGVGFFANLEKLDCIDNNLSELDVSNNTALENLFCYRNNLTELDVSHNTALWQMQCNENFLTELDISNNATLAHLLCFDNSLTELNVTNNTELESLDCSGNSLTKLDVSNNIALRQLGCDNNSLTELDVSNNTFLETLRCSNNSLTALDVSNNTALDYLTCEGNSLTELDVSNNPALEILYCSGNSLTELDVSNNTALTHMGCVANGLTVLDVSNNTALEALECQRNNLTKLDLRQNTELIHLYWGSESMETIYFGGDGCNITGYTYPEATVTFYYPANNDTWLEHIEAEYPFDVIWVPYEKEQTPPEETDPEESVPEETPPTETVPEKSELTVESTGTVRVTVDGDVSKLLTAEEIAQGLDVQLKVAEVKPKEEAQKQLESALPEGTLVQYLDITMEKSNGQAMHELAQKVRIVLAVPEAYRYENAIYYVVRLHDGKLEALEDLDSDPNTVTIETDRFSAYALGYVRKSTPATPQTGELGKPELLAAVLAMALMGMAALYTMRKRFVK